MIEILTKKADWGNFLKVIDNYDFYYTYDYHQIVKSESDKALLVKYENEGIAIGLPILVREIKGTKYYDAISVYGYSGPIYSKIPMGFNDMHYKKCLLDFFMKENIVSVFLRLNPFLPSQNIIFYRFGELSYLGRVVNINLSLSLEDQRKKYPRSLKTQTNKANRLLTMKVAKTKEDIKKFKDLYLSTMQRVNAKGFYFFDEEYFHKFKDSNDFQTDILLAIENESGKVIAGGMFIKTNSFVQYHLSGASEEHMHLNATKFLIDKMRLRANEEGYENFNLGGGLGANENDSLFNFKSLFSDEYHPFFVWKFIVNKKVYKSLCKKNKIINKKSTFFPLYRLKEKIDA